MTASEKLFGVIEDHNVAAVSRLLAEGADPNYLHVELSYYPLHAAIFEMDFGGSPDIIDLLIQAGADVNRIDGRVNGAPPLVAALLDGQREVARQLLAAGADPTVSDRLGHSPLRASVEREDIQSAELLLRHGAERTIDEAGGVSGRNALGMAVAQLNVEMVELLIKAGANVNALDVDRLPPRYHLPSRTRENERSWDKIAELLGGQRHS
jgi:ankyrin repeat protein